MTIVDLSHKVNSGTPTYPGDFAVKLQKVKNFESGGINSFSLTTTLHTGTHIDMPMHFMDNNITAADYDLENFIGEAIVLDCRGELEITVKPEYNTVSEGKIVVVYTGFSDNYYDSNLYFKQHPVFSIEFAQFFVDKKVKAIAMDIPSPDLAPFPIHKLLLSNGIFIAENLTNLNLLLNTKQRIQLHAVPLALNAEASLIRAYAILF